MIKFFKILYLNNLLFYLLMVVIVFFIIAFYYPLLYSISKVLFFILLLLLCSDTIIIFTHKNGIKAKRILPERFSNGDQNTIELKITNWYNFSVIIDIIDELPFQFQKRGFNIALKLKPGEQKTVKYYLRPTERGIFEFGKLNIYLQTELGLVKKRYIFNANQTIPCYPSFLQLRKYQLLAISNKLQFYGFQKMRRIGHTMEFDQLKEYVPGDDVRHINWKSSAKYGKLIVNQFQDERSQPVYSIIDKGRVMKMPFNELSLLDYAINATLVLSNIILNKHDKAGLMTLSNEVNDMIIAEKRNNQMHLIMEKLYNINTDFKETDFGKLYEIAKRKITQRSLFVIYTNFETMDALKRQLKYIKALSKLHLLVIIIFKNTELDQVINKKTKSIQDVYDKTIAEKFNYEKRLIVLELNKFGIHTILTQPKDLTTDTINKYLEMKSRGIF